ncbi:hypothetical protein DFJ74DRAFT_714538 [Hyaloraphidium curvatum]|nr:hypothetical protein DFJ74DRAFT_714538 [Hyaloraphidium curvatum]
MPRLRSGALLAASGLLASLLLAPAGAHARLLLWFPDPQQPWINSINITLAAGTTAPLSVASVADTNIRDPQGVESIYLSTVDASGSFTNGETVLVLVKDYTDFCGGNASCPSGAWGENWPVGSWPVPRTIEVPTPDLADALNATPFLAMVMNYTSRYENWPAGRAGGEVPRQSSTGVRFRNVEFVARGGATRSRTASRAGTTTAAVVATSSAAPVPVTTSAAAQETTQAPARSTSVPSGAGAMHPLSQMAALVAAVAVAVAWGL